MLFIDLLLLNCNGAKGVLVMAKKCLERAEDIFIDVMEKKTAVVNDQAPPLPARNKTTYSEECRESNGVATVRLVVTLS